MATKKTKNQRLPIEIIDDLNNAMNTRFKNDLIKKNDLIFAEGFRLIRRMPEWSTSLEKLKKLPKKEDTW